MGACPANQDLQRLLEDALNEAEEAILEQHLMACPKCMEFLEEMTDSFGQRLPATPAEEQPSEAWVAFLHNLAAKPPRADELESSASVAAAPCVPGFTILEELGRGGMGVVYKARDLKLCRLVALKCLLDGASQDRIARFRHEALAVAKLSHPNIVQIYEVVEHEGRPYLSMEYVDGVTLTKKVDHQQAEAREAATCVAALAKATQVAHHCGITHRDLKPDNVLLASALPVEGVMATTEAARSLHGLTLKITDFGLAKWAHGEADQTQSGDFLGTPAYMAPE